MNTTPDPILSAHDVSKHLNGPAGRIDILHGVNLDIAAGDSVAIVGASGSGKTTLLGLLASLDLASSGRIVLDGQVLDELDEEARAALRRRLVGFVFQSFHLLPALTAEENVLLPLELAAAEDARSRTREALQAVGLDARGKHYPYQLSGGEQQRVALARAFVHQPRVLFADEPTGNLDQLTGAAISALLFELNTRHATTLVLVTHDTELARRCDRTLSLREGHLVDDSA